MLKNYKANLDRICPKKQLKLERPHLRLTKEAPKIELKRHPILELRRQLSI